MTPTPTPSNTPGPKPHQDDDDHDDHPSTPGPAVEVFQSDNLGNQTGWAITGSSGIGAANANGISGNVYAQPIVVDGIFVRLAAEIGVQSLIDRGVVQAVDVFGLLPNGVSAMTFAPPVRICLRASGGTLYFRDASTAERSLVQLVPVAENGYLCVELSSAGTLILVQN